MPSSPDLHVPLIRIKETADINFFPADDNQAEVCLVYSMVHDTKVCLDFLEKVFNAVRLSLSKDTASIKLKAQEGFSLILHPAFEQYKIWISFGTAPEILGLQFENRKYDPIIFQGHTFLFADSPQVIMEDPQLKKLLWVSLQKLFPIK